MNERLHEIMMEATKDMPHCYYWPGEYVEKFTNLIVRECVNQLQELDSLKIPNEQHQKLVDATHKSTVTIGVAKIKKHFGVE